MGWILDHSQIDRLGCLKGNILDDGVSRYFWDPRPIMRFHKKGGTSGYYRYSDYTADGLMTARRGYTVDPVVNYAQLGIGASPSGQRLSERLWDMNFEIVGGRELVWLGERLIATFDINESDPDYIFTDHIGYPVMVMNSSGSTTWSAVHEPYGEALLTGGAVADDPLLRYPGQWRDDPAFVVTDPPQRNLFANGYRWYNPDWGRYTQTDPIFPGGGNMPFTYVQNRPLRFIDPLGLTEIDPGPGSPSRPNTSDCCEDDVRFDYDCQRSHLDQLLKGQYPQPCAGGVGTRAQLAGAGLSEIRPGVWVNTNGGISFEDSFTLLVPDLDPCVEWCVRVHEYAHYRDTEREFRGDLNSGNPSLWEAFDVWQELPAYQAGVRCLKSFIDEGF